MKDRITEQKAEKTCYDSPLSSKPFKFNPGFIPRIPGCEILSTAKVEGTCGCGADMLTFNSIDPKTKERYWTNPSCPDCVMRYEYAEQQKEVRKIQDRSFDLQLQREEEERTAYEMKRNRKENEAYASEAKAEKKRGGYSNQYGPVTL